MAGGLDSKTKRQSLEWAKDYQEPLAKGRYLVYRRPKNGGAGTWACKLRNEGRKVNYTQEQVGVADDVLAANGIDILSYDQAKRAADICLQRLTREADLASGGEVIHKGPFTVADAWNLYIQAAKRRGVVGVEIMTYTANAHILPVLGEIQVSKLSKARIEKWHQGIAESGKRKTGGKREKPELMEAPATPEQIRQRRDSANRILTNLKSALNFALDSGMVQEPAPWVRVKPFPNTASSRVRFLTDDEQRKLIESCSEDLKPLVTAALYTGARYGELSQVLVSDFDPINRNLHIRFGKGKSGTKPRYVILTAEGAEWFADYTTGRRPQELMFLRTDVNRTTRADSLTDHNKWATYDQSYEMDKAVLKAGIDRVTFHELRHTFASTNLNDGLSLSYIAEQLGHSDTRMVTKYYGHIADKAKTKAVRKMPRHNLTSKAGQPKKKKRGGKLKSDG